MAHLTVDEILDSINNLKRRIIEREDCVMSIEFELKLEKDDIDAYIAADPTLDPHLKQALLDQYEDCEAWFRLVNNFVNNSNLPVQTKKTMSNKQQRMMERKKKLPGNRRQ